MPDKPKSVLLAALPADRIELRNTALAEQWRPVQQARDVVNRALEGVKGRQQSAVTLTADPAIYVALHPFLDRLPALLLVSSVTLRTGKEPGLQVAHDGLAPGVKCARCWVQITDGGDDPAGVCAAGCARSWLRNGDTAARRLPSVEERN